MTQQTLFTVPQTEYTSDDYYTPKWLFDALKLTFDLDVACPPEGPLHTPTKAFYTQKDDGLAQPWYGLVFMNPPFSNYTPWLNKWLQHKNGILICPVVKSQWFYDLWNSEARLTIGDPDKSGMKFTTHEGTKRIMPNVMIGAIGTTAINALINSNLYQVR